MEKRVGALSYVAEGFNNKETTRINHRFMKDDCRIYLRLPKSFIGAFGDYANFLRIDDCDANEQVGGMPDMIYGIQYDSDGQPIGRDYQFPHQDTRQMMEIKNAEFPKLLIDTEYDFIVAFCFKAKNVCLFQKIQK